MSDNTVLFASFCLLHQLHLTASVALSSRLGTISQIYSTSRLFRLPGYLKRISSALQPAIYHHLELKLRKAGDEVMLAAARAKNEAQLLFCGFDPESSEAIRLLSLLNTDWSGDKMVHMCNGVCCACKAFSSPEPRKFLANAICNILEPILFGNLPPVPIMSRWTRVASTLSWFSLGCALHGVLPKATAFDAKFCAEVLQRAAGAIVPEDGCVVEMGAASRDHWVKTVSSRLQKSVAFFANSNSRAELIAMTSVASTTQYLSTWLMSDDKPLVSLASPLTSPLVLIQQYLGRLLEPNGCTPLADPTILLHQALKTSSGLWMRIELRLQNWDYLLLTLPFMSRVEAVRIAQGFFKCKTCCLNPMFSRRVRALIDQEAEGLDDMRKAKALMGPVWQQVLMLGSIFLFFHALSKNERSVPSEYQRRGAGRFL